MNFRLGLVQKIVLIGIFPLLCQILFAGLLISVIGGTVNTAELESKYQRIAVLTQTICLRSQDKILVTLESNRDRQQPERALIPIYNQIKSGFNELSALSGSSPELAAKMPDLKSVQNEVIGMFKWMSHVAHSKEGINHAYLIEKDKRLEQIEQHLFDIIAPVVRLAELNRANLFAQLKQTQERLFSMVLTALPLSLFVSAVPAWIIVTGVIRPIKRIAHNSKNLAQGKPPERSESKTDDEIGDFEDRFFAISKAVLESNRREEELINNVLDVICTVDREGKILKINPAVETLTGSSQANMVGTYVTDIASQDSKAQADGFFQSLGQTASECELQLQTSRSNLVETRWSCFYSPSQDACFCVVQNITEERALARLRLKMIEAISESLRNPLMSMSDSLNQVASGSLGALGPKAAQEAGLARSNLNRLVEFVDDVLDYQNLSTGTLPLTKEPHNVREVAQTAFLSVASSAAAKDVSLQVSADESLSAICDAQKIRQVLVNLISNALRYSPEGSTITVQSVSRDDFVEFAVLDHGPGIPAEWRQKIFQPFEQLGSGKSRAGQAGLGLAICRLIVEAHNGTIGVSSRSDYRQQTPDPSQTGSAFWFRLPEERTGKD